MATVIREDIDQLHAKLTVNISYEDYASDLDKKIREFKGQSKMRGFRKGKTPKSVLLKMYGRPIMSDLVNQVLQKKLSEYIQSRGNDFIGNPLPAENHPNVNLDPFSKDDISFIFDIGLVPNFDLQGIEPTDGLVRYKLLEFPQEEVEKSFLQYLKSNSSQIEVEDGILEEDIVELEAIEVQENGQEGRFSIFVGNELTEAFKEEIVGKKVGDELEFNILQIEKENDRKYVAKYFLSLEEEVDFSELFKFKVLGVKRLELSETNEEWLKKHFGEEVTTVEEAKQFLADKFAQQYEGQVAALLDVKIQKILIERNDIQLPDEFMKKWLLSLDEKQTVEAIEAAYPEVKNRTVWSLITQKVQQENDITVNEQEIFNYQYKVLAGQYSGLNQQVLHNIVINSLQKQEQVDQAYRGALSEKIFKVLRSSDAIEEVRMVKPELEKVVEAEYEKFRAEQELTVEAAKEELIMNVDTSNAALEEMEITSSSEV